MSVSFAAGTLEPGQLFIAIRGERHDGHAFVGPAVERGAAGLVVEESWLTENTPRSDACIIGVADSTIALGALAKGHRSGFAGPVIAVTGSNGKTTTKELIYCILSVSGPCLKNPGNLNNEFGLPLSLLSRREEHLKAVVELGMNHRGEIARLTAIASPDVGLVTNIGSAHIEFLGSREEIAKEKGDLVAGLGPDGVAILNHDDPLAMAQAVRAAGSVRTFGRGQGADVSAEDVKAEPDGHYSFKLVAPEGSVEVRVYGLAETAVINSLAASAAALEVGADLEDIAAGLANFRGVEGRMASRSKTWFASRPMDEPSRSSATWVSWARPPNRPTGRWVNWPPNSGSTGSSCSAKTRVGWPKERWRQEWTRNQFMSKRSKT